MVIPTNTQEQGWTAPTLVGLIGGGASVDEVWSTTDPDLLAFKAKTPGGVQRLKIRAEYQGKMSGLIGTISGRAGDWSFELRVPKITQQIKDTYFVPRAQGFSLQHSETASLDIYKNGVREFLGTSTIHKILALRGYLMFLKKLKAFNILFTDHKKDSIFLHNPTNDLHHMIITIVDPGDNNEQRVTRSPYGQLKVAPETAALIEVIRSFFVDSLGSFSLEKRQFSFERYEAFTGDRETTSEDIQQLVPTIVETSLIHQLFESDNLDFASVIDILLEYCKNAQTSGTREQRDIQHLDQLTTKLSAQL